MGRDRELQGLRLHRQGRHRALVRARAARHHRRRGGRGRRRRPRGAHAVAHARRCRATTCTLSLDIKLQEVAEAAFGDRRGALVAIDPAHRRRPRVRVASPATTRTSSSTASTRRTGRCSTSRRTSRCSTGRCAARIRRARRSSRSWRSARSPRASARRRRRSSIPGYLPASRRRRTASATTSRAATAPSTCTSRSSCRATRTTTCSRARPTSTTRARFLSQLGFGRKTGIDIEGELTGVLPSREWKRQRFAGKKYRDEHRKWYLGDSISAGIGQGYNAFTPMQLAHAIAIDRQRRRRVSGRTSCKTIANLQHRRGARGRARSRRTRSRSSPSTSPSSRTRWSASTRKARAPRAFARRAVRERRQDRHRAGVSRSRARSTSRSKVDERLRDHAWFIAYAPADKPTDRARRAGRERRLRRAGGGADRAPGVRLRTCSARTKPGRRRSCRRRDRRRRERLMRCRDSWPRVGSADAPHRQLPVRRRAGDRRRRARHAVLRGRPERRARDEPGREPRASRWC